jgi:hypothetical protein
VLALLLLLWRAVFAFVGPRIGWPEKILEEPTRSLLTLAAGIAIVTKKLGLGGSGEGDFDRGRAGAFGYR